MRKLLGLVLAICVLVLLFGKNSTGIQSIKSKIEIQLSNSASLLKNGMDGLKNSINKLKK
jgi:hypothetical protein